MLNKFFELSTQREPHLQRAFHNSYTMDSSKVTQAIANQVAHEHEIQQQEKAQQAAKLGFTGKPAMTPQSQPSATLSLQIPPPKGGVQLPGPDMARVV